MLMLHKGCRRVVRADLADIPVPEAAGRHLPVPHHVLADTVVATAEDLGLPLRSESWGLACRPAPPGGRRQAPYYLFWGALDFDPIAKLRMPEGTGPSLGIRHASVGRLSQGTLLSAMASSGSAPSSRPSVNLTSVESAILPIVLPANVSGCPPV